ncbi:TIGR02757 family protein [Bizionia sediminis]|uniref:TIGR02757 family protein n=1 Tax=Bizionia sediminis TaxID=1737064 RepID=A0ABW5KP81_9FLAO
MQKLLSSSELKAFLDAKVNYYNTPEFLDTDPIKIPHTFSKKEDIEIAAFLTATISWGNRKSIITNAQRMMALLEQDPYHFVMHHQEPDLKKLLPFVHRTFNGTDFITFISGLKHIYSNYNGLETIFAEHAKSTHLQAAIHTFKQRFFEIPHLTRTEKHISDPLKNSAAKRINMFLRWMVRPADTGVDFGLWKSVHTKQLSCPLDVHSGNVARKLGLLTRNQNDAKAVLELDTNLRQLDPNDPVKYDFALFGLGVFEGF